MSDERNGLLPLPSGLRGDENGLLPLPDGRGAEDAPLMIVDREGWVLATVHDPLGAAPWVEVPGLDPKAFVVVAGRFCTDEADGRNTKRISEPLSLDDALLEYDRCAGYPWRHIEYKGRRFEPEPLDA